MNTRTLFLGICAALTLTGANAQLRSLDSTRDGTGSLSFQTRSSGADFRRVRVQLRNDGAGTIWLSNGANDSLSGRWQSSGARSATLYVDRFGGDRASGTCSIQHDARGAITGLSGNGSIGSTRFTLTFRAGGGGAVGGGYYDGMLSAEDGDGRVRYSGLPDGSVQRLTVNLDRNGRFELSAIRGHSVAWSGTYRMRGRTAELDVTAMNGRPARGSGTVEVDTVRNSYNRVELTGREGRNRFSFDFTSDRFGRPGGDWDRDRRERDRDWGGGDWRDRERNDGVASDREFRDNVTRALRGKFGGRFTDVLSVNIGPVTRGNRTVTGEVQVSNGPESGRYRYSAVMSADRAIVKSLTTNRVGVRRG